MRDDDGPRDDAPGPDGTDGRPAPRDPGARPSDDALAALPDSPVRRAPRFRAFVATGAGVGLVAALVVVLAGPAERANGPSAGVVLLFVAAAFALVGALGGALVAVLLDRRSRRASAG